MIARFVAIHDDPEQFRIAFRDQEGRHWFVRLQKPVTATALGETLKAMDLIAENPEKAVAVGALRQEALDEANADMQRRAFEKHEMSSKEWKM